MRKIRTPTTRSAVCMALVGCFLIALAGTANSGPLEDGDAASQRGDSATAVQIFRSLAVQGNTAAQLRLGVMYGMGRGVPKARAEALKWYFLAAEAGDAFCQDMIGHLYAEGAEVKVNYVEAYKWLDLAASRYPERMKHWVVPLRDTIVAKMTPAQVADAQELVRKWKPTTR